MSNGKVMIIYLTDRLIKMILYETIQYFSKPYEPFGGDISVKVDLSKYATKTENETGIDISKLAAKSDLLRLNAEVDKLDIEKLIPVPVDLSKQSNVVRNDKFLAKMNNTDTIGFVSKTKYDLDKSDLEKKVLDPSGLVKKLDYNAKITEIEGKIPSISGFATNAALTAVENKILNMSSLVKK